MKVPLIFWAVCSFIGCLIAERSPLLKHAAFSSTNFENIFTWESEAPTPPGMVYDVQYKQYGEKDWHEKSECQNITQLFCDLTHETKNFKEYYYARVRAVVLNCCSYDWISSQRFHPREDTTFGEPEVKYVPSVRSIMFLIQPPYTPLRDENGFQLTIEDIYSIDYHVTLFNQRTRQKQWERNLGNKEIEVFNLDPDTEYNCTIYLKHLEKRGKPQVFRVRTLPDNTWLLYFFGGITFATGLLFAMICYVIYKYIKQHTAQPKSLDFRGISAFQPLTITAFISPINNLSTLDEQIYLLKHLFPLPEPAYQPQAKVSEFQPIIQSASQPDAFSSVYAPQAAQENLPCTLKNKPLALTYGVCVESTSHSNTMDSQLEQMLQDVSPERFVSGQLKTKTPGEQYSDGNYKEQRPKLVERILWERRNTESRGTEFSLEYTGQTQQPLLRKDCEEAKLHMPLQSLSPLEEGGSYRRQMEDLLPLLSSLTTDTNSVLEARSPSSSSSLLLKKVRTCDDLPEEGSTGQWVLLNSLSHPENKQQPLDFQTSDVQPGAREPGCLELNRFAPSGPGSIQDTDMPFTTLFRDLDLKLQWEHGLDVLA